MLDIQWLYTHTHTHTQKKNNCKRCKLKRTIKAIPNSPRPDDEPLKSIRQLYWIEYLIPYNCVPNNLI